MDERDQSALAHYNALIAAFVPSPLAAALAAARYQHNLSAATLELPQIKSALEVVSATHPDLKRDAGRTIAAIERQSGARRGRKVA